VGFVASAVVFLPQNTNRTELCKPTLLNHYQAGLTDTIFPLLHVLPKEHDSYCDQIVWSASSSIPVTF
jgi:hypothetical protein